MPTEAEALRDHAVWSLGCIVDDLRSIYADEGAEHLVRELPAIAEAWRRLGNLIDHVRRGEAA